MKKTLVLVAIFVMAIGTAAFAKGHGVGHDGGSSMNGHNGGNAMGGHNGGNGMGGCSYKNNNGAHGGMNCGNGANVNCGGYGMGMGMDNMPTESAVKSEKDAEALVQKHLAENYKGYKIAKTESFSAPRGSAYKVTVNDASGNAFIFHVNPWGSVRGPFLSK